MASTQPKPGREDRHPLLQRPLYAYDLPSEIISTLALKSTSATSPETSDPTAVDSQAGRADRDENDISSATTCKLCGFTGGNVSEQRTHVKSDFHHFNVKRRTRGEDPVSEPEFERLIEQLTESISGSDDESSATDEDTSNLSTLLRKKAVINNTTDSYDDDPNRKQRNRGPGAAPLVWFSTPSLPANTSLGIYRTLFTPTEQSTSSYLPALQSKQLSANPNDRHIVMLMLGGGHFAGMIVSLTPKSSPTVTGDRAATVLAHKTFHRYTTRRKQGGSQSANDNSKGNAHSAGAGIRRHNEAALMQEVRDMLKQWKPLIDTADLIFIRATGTQNRKIMFGYEEAVLSSKDSRIRGFPFNTRRATQSELMRCFVELTRVKVSTLTPEALAALTKPPSPPPQSASPKPHHQKQPTKPKLSEEDEESLHHTSQLLPLLRRQKIPSLISYLTSNSLSATTFRLFPPSQHRHAPTLLHHAAANSIPLAASGLLLKAGADPTIRNDDGKTAFEVAGDRDTRDAFRIARYELGDSAWDWGLAKVPAGVSRREVEERKKKEEGERKEELMRDVEEAKKEVRRREEEERKKRVGEGRNLGGAGLVTGLGQEGMMRGLSEEAKKRLERERRARAAEERIRRMQGGN